MEGLLVGADEGLGVGCGEEHVEELRGPRHPLAIKVLVMPTTK